MTVSFNDYYYHSAAYVEMYPRYAQHSITLVATCNLPGSETCIHRLLRISTTVSRIVSCLPAVSLTRLEGVVPCVFPTGLNRNLIRIYKRLKKKKREIKYFLGLYIYSIYRFQIQFEQRPNTNCPNEAACRVPVSFGNLIMPTFNYDTRAHIMTALTY